MNILNNMIIKQLESQIPNENIFEIYEEVETKDVNDKKVVIPKLVGAYSIQQLEMLITDCDNKINQATEEKTKYQSYLDEIEQIIN